MAPSRRPSVFLKPLALLIFIGSVVALGYNYYQLHHETTEAEIKEIEALIVAGKGDEARALMVSAQTRSKNIEALRLRIGRAYLHEGNVGPATAMLRQVEGSLSTEERVAVAEYFLVSGDPFSATKFYDAALKSGLPRTAANLGRYGEAQSLAGNGDLAVGAFREALALDASRSRVRLNLAVTLANLGRYGESRAEVAALLKSEPTNEKALKLSAALQNAR